MIDDHGEEEMLARWFFVMGLDDILENCEALSTAWNTLDIGFRRYLINNAIRTSTIPFSEDVIDATERILINKGVQ